MEEYPFHSQLKPQYKGYTKNSLYITMRDGVKIAIDIVLPKNLPAREKIPAILYLTRYWRSYGFKPWIGWILKEIPERHIEQKIATQHGYAFIKVDVRGTGASFGTRPYPWAEDEIADYREIIDWIILQPWSNGNIVTYGSSYPGVCAEQVATLNHPAIKAIVPMHNYIDLYTDIAFPGGAYNKFFITHWANIGRHLDKNSIEGLLEIYPILKYIVKGVVPVESDTDLELFNSALKEHSSNIYMSELDESATYRDDIVPQFGNKTIDRVSIFSKKEQIEKTNIPFYSWGSWLDGTSADVVITRFINYDLPHLAVIGDWNHSVRNRANLYYPKDRKANPNKKEQVKSCIAFFQKAIRGFDISEKTLYYYTMGEERWKKTSSWPPQGQKMMRWFFNENKTLTIQKPQEELGEDSYKINFNSTSGTGNRWYTNIGMKTQYLNRVEEDKNLLVFDSNPLDKDIEITGHPIITLFLSSTHEDGMIFAYLEDVDENGDIVYITEGLLRLIHRKVSNKTPPYKTMVPYHSYMKKDSQPMILGEIAEVSFGFLPTSVLIRKNHKLRIAIAGADKDTFKRYPSEGTPTITVMRNNEYSSFIDIPIIKK